MTPKTTTFFDAAAAAFRKEAAGPYVPYDPSRQGMPERAQQDWQRYEQGRGNQGILDRGFDWAQRAIGGENGPQGSNVDRGQTFGSASQAPERFATNVRNGAAGSLAALASGGLATGGLVTGGLANAGGAAMLGTGMLGGGAAAGAANLVDQGSRKNWRGLDWDEAMGATATGAGVPVAAGAIAGAPATLGPAASGVGRTAFNWANSGPGKVIGGIGAGAGGALYLAARGAEEGAQAAGRVPGRFAQGVGQGAPMMEQGVNQIAQHAGPTARAFWNSGLNALKGGVNATADQAGLRPSWRLGYSGSQGALPQHPGGPTPNPDDLW